MAAIAVGDILRIRVLCSQGDQLGENVRNWQVGTLAGTVSDLDVASFMDLHLSALYKPLLTENATYRGVGVRILRGPPTLAEAVARDLAGPGTGGPNSLPFQDCPLISFQSLLAGQGFRGRTYIPFAPVTSLDADGNVVAAYLALMTPLGAFYSTPQVVDVGGASASLTPVLYRKVPLRITPVTTFVNRLGIATQKRRGFFGRANTFPF